MHSPELVTAMTTTSRRGLVDAVLIRVDRALQGLVNPGPVRQSPADPTPEANLDPHQRSRVGALMRVNHAGEVAAQALYRGQAMAARDAELRTALEAAAEEEGDHLGWCRQRLAELDDRPSRLDPLWYVGSFLIGSAAGLVGDRVSLGFLAETERQVVEHLEGHLDQLPEADEKTRAVLTQMREDEQRHATTAVESGGIPLPGVVRHAMRLAAKVMTRTAYWV